MIRKKGNPFEESIEMKVEQEAMPDQDQVKSAASATGIVDDELQEMTLALTAAEQELALHRDAMLRMQAEMENLRKRLIRDLEKSRRFALERIMKDLLQVRDSMDRGLEIDAESTTATALLEGAASSKTLRL